MEKFDKRFVPLKTRVKINGEWWTVKEIHETRQWITVEGLIGSFQRNHVEKFTNKEEAI